MSEEDLRIVGELFERQRRTLSGTATWHQSCLPGQGTALRQSASLRATSERSCQICAALYAC